MLAMEVVRVLPAPTSDGMKSHLSAISSMKREIEEYPPAPVLSLQTIELLTRLCFRKDDLDIPAVDCIFVFGSTHSLDLLAKQVYLLIQKKVSKTIILSGGYITYQGSQSYEMSQAKMIYQQISSFLPTDVEVLLEDTSQNTLENVYLGLQLLPFPISSLCFVTKNFHCGRSYFTLRRHLEQATLFQRSYEPFCSDIDLTIRAETWHRHPLGRARIWGEFLRIKEYGKRKDISTEECEQLIASIN